MPDPAVLTTEDLAEIHAALVDAYDLDQMDTILRLKWGMPLAREVDTGGGYGRAFVRLIEWTRQQGRARDLLALAYSQKPDNPLLKALAQRLLAETPGTVERYAPPAGGNLQAAVRERRPTLVYDTFMAGMTTMGRAICRVVTPVKYGTGFLIAPNAVLTNFHVIEEVIDSPHLAENVVCEFDFHDANRPTVARSLAAGNGWCPAHRPYSRSDLRGVGEPTDDELDYALLVLAEPFTDRRPLGLPPRSAATDRRRSTVVLPLDVVMIPQHREGLPLEIGFGNVVEFPASGLRQRYDATTNAGSSGAPVFTTDLQLIGLHHAAEAAFTPRYNQSIPIWRIADSLDAGGFLPAGV